LIGSVG